MRLQLKLVLKAYLLAIGLLAKKMKYIQKLNFKFQNIKKSQKTNIMRKLDMKEQRLKRQFVVRSCEDYIAELEAEYEARNHTPRFWPKRSKDECLYNDTFHEAIGGAQFDSSQDLKHTGSFQEAIRPVLVLAQVFALMPVKGITYPMAQNLSFSWFNIRTYYSFIAIVSIGVSGSFSVAHALRHFDFDAVETLIFYTSIFLISIGFFNLARKWPNLVLVWQDVENKLPAYRTPHEKTALARHIKRITFLCFVSSVVEHVLSMMGNIHFVINCPVLPNRPWASFLYINFSSVFSFIGYSDFIGVIGKFINVLSTFAWNFTDIFVMAMSVALAARFRQLNDYMQREVALGPKKADFWIKCRINYRNLCKLVDAVDDVISTLTLLGYSNDLYFVCIKILRSLHKKPSFSHVLYFWFSLIYLLVRTFILSLYCASINDESKKPLSIFRTISREYWCAELKRFSNEVATDCIALTGMKFFKLTRGVVVSVAGTIVTYELILLQFNKDDKVHNC